MRPNPSGTTREFTPPTTAASRTPARSWTLWNEHSTAFRSNRNKFSVTCALFSDHMSLYLCPFVYRLPFISEEVNQDRPRLGTYIITFFVIGSMTLIPK